MVTLLYKCMIIRHYIIGIIVLLCVLLLVYKIFFATSYNKKFYSYKAYFTSGEGLSSKTPIMLFGYKIGSIKKIYLDKEYNPTAILAIEKKVVVPDDSTISVKENGFMGEKLLQLNLGISEDTLQNNDTFTYTNSGISLLKLVNMLIDYVSSIRKSIIK